MKIIYFDNHIVVVSKPCGIPTQSETEESVESKARLWGKQTFQKSGEMFLHALHRLDKPVSGIVLLAKTSKALERLHASFRRSEMKKTYIALVEGSLIEKRGVWEDYLIQEEYRASVSSKEVLGSKFCRLSYQVVMEYVGYSLVEIILDTGRYHQIRVQFSSRGHPIVGDLKYGGRFLSNRKEIALHHQRFEMPHPITKERLVFEDVDRLKAFQQFAQH